VAVWPDFSAKNIDILVFSYILHSIDGLTAVLAGHETFETILLLNLEIEMKKIIAIVAIIASAQASAFWDSSNGNTNGAYKGNGDFVGNGTGEGEATFSMNFSGKGRTNGDFKGNGTTDGNMAGYSYETPYYAPYAAPVAPAAPAAPAAK
jgi:hypothetical protein